MKIVVEITLPDEDLTGLLKACLSVFTAPVVVVNEEKPAEEPKSTRSRKKADNPEAEPVGDPAPETTVDAPETSTDAPAETAKAVTREEVLKAAEAYLKSSKDGPSKMAKLLQKIGAARVREIPEEKLADFLALLAVE
jgi:hypothetical protein